MAERRFVQLLAFRDEMGRDLLYAVATDGTAWCLTGGKSWTPVIALPRDEVDAAERGR